MSSLNPVEKRYLENILGMGKGYVLDFTDATFAEFFKRFRVDIHDFRYWTYGKSKAKKMRAFWERESDMLVASVLSQMLASYEVYCDLTGHKRDVRTLVTCRKIVARLSGKAPATKAVTRKSFLDKEFEVPDIRKLPVEPDVAEIIEARLKEARAVLSAGAYLSVIFLCGSVLEAVLLGAARQEPEKFGRSSASPKYRDGKVKKFPDWSLAEFIDVACDISLLNPDDKKFGHALRDFRNYIHPNEQLRSGFAPDANTAKLSFQALKGALASVAGER